MTQTTLDMAKELVSAQIKAGRVSAEDMTELLTRTHQALLVLDSRHETGAAQIASPPVNWKKSITKHAVSCLECGVTFKQIGSRHLKMHGLDGRTYREKYGIPKAQALAAKAITARRKEIVEQVKPWEKTRAYKKSQGQAGGTAKMADEIVDSSAPAKAKRKARAKRVVKTS